MADDSGTAGFLGIILGGLLVILAIFLVFGGFNFGGGGGGGDQVDVEIQAPAPGGEG